MEILITILVFASVSSIVYYSISYFKRLPSFYSKHYFKTPLKDVRAENLILPDSVLFKYSFASSILIFTILLLLTYKMNFFFRIVILSIGSIGGYIIPHIFVKMAALKRKKMFNSQIVDALNSIGRGLKTGLSLVQALERAGNYLPPPIGEELLIVVREYNLGVGLDEALNNLYKRTGDPDIRLAVESIIITRQLGANLPEMFDEISDTIRERNYIERKINALTAQGKMQGLIVALVPLFFALIIHFINPELMRVLYTTVGGWIIIIGVIILYLIGYFFIKKIVSIEM